MAEQGAMFDEFVVGGLLDDANVRINLARFISWDYKGSIPVPVLALHMDLQDGENQVHDENLSCGDLKSFVPSSDGKKAIPVGTQQKLNINTNAVAFLVSLINADTRGELAAKLRGGDDISVLDGTMVHVFRKVQPKRPGIATPEVAEGQKTRDRTVLLVDKVLSYGWENGAAQPAATAPAATAAAPVTTAPATAQAPAAAAPTGGAAEAAAGLLVRLIGEAPNTELKVQSIAGKVFSDSEMKAVTPAVRNGILAVIVKPEFLGAPDQPWTYDKAAGVVKFG